VADRPRQRTLGIPTLGPPELEEPLRPSRQLFRTLYCAEHPRTAFREVLADFRPNAKARAEYRELFGTDLPAPRISAAWRDTKVLARGTLELLRGDLADLDEPTLRLPFARAQANLLTRLGVDHLDIAQIRSKDRALTQAVTRFLAEKGAAGVLYGSNLDDQPCAALFEGRARLSSVTGYKPEPLTLPHPELLAVCEEFGLVLEP